MEQALHPSATTTYHSGKEIQKSKKPLKELATSLNISYSTAKKWKNREFVEDVRSGRRKGEATVLTQVEQRIICEIRAKIWMPLDDLYILLKPHMPLLSRSNLHRCLQRNGINRKPTCHEDIRQKKAFRKFEFSYVHLDLFDAKIGKEKHYSFVAVARCSHTSNLRRRKQAWRSSFANSHSRLGGASQGKSWTTSSLTRRR